MRSWVIGCAVVLLVLFPGVAAAYQPGDRVAVPPGKAVVVPHGGGAGTLGVTAEEGKWFVYSADLNYGFQGRFYSTYTLPVGSTYGRTFANYGNRVQYLRVDEVPDGREGVVFSEEDPPMTFGLLWSGVTYRFQHNQSRSWAAVFSDDPGFADKAVKENGGNPTGLQDGYGFYLSRNDGYVEVTPDRDTWVAYNSGFRLTPLQAEIVDPVARAVRRGAQTLLEAVVVQSRILVGGSLWLVVLLLSLILLVRVLRGFLLR